MRNYVRTQISLPVDLKRKITREARQRDISMAEYLRKAADAYEKHTRLERARRAKIARELAGSLKGKSGWGKMSKREIYQWIRRERERSDERLERIEHVRGIVRH